MAVIRALRLLRVFRIFKLTRFLSEAENLRRTLVAGRAKITVFLATVLILVTIIGSAMHLVEGPEHGFTSIPQGMYWAVVTLTTVGYGDLAPATVLGKSLASIIMVMGYSLIVVPTGILSAEFALSGRPRLQMSTRSCPGCGAEGHALGSHHCHQCGEAL